MRLLISLMWFVRSLVIGKPKRILISLGYLLLRLIGMKCLLLSSSFAHAQIKSNEVTVDFRSVPLRPLAEFYSKLSDKPVIVPTYLPIGEITVSSGRKLASREALQLLDAALEANGYKMLCQSNFCTIEDLTQYVAPTNFAAAVLPPQIITDYYRLQHANPEAATALIGSNEMVRVSLDGRQRMLILQGEKENILAVRSKLFEIDRPLRGVTVEAVIVEVDCATNNTTGVDLFQRVLRSGVGAIAGGSKTSEQAAPVNLLSLTPTPANIVGNGTFWLTLKGLKLDALLRLIDSDRNFEVLSKPILTVLDGEQADLSIGQQRPYIQQALSSSSFGVQLNTNALNQVVGSTVAFLDLSLGLTVRPKIGGDDLIELQILQQANDFGGEIQLPTGVVPIVNKRSVKTIAQARNGEVLLLGGLVRKEKNISSEGLPKIRKVPVIGKVFGEETKSTAKNELLVFIRATIQEPHGH